jgi:hypothetical protein
LQHGSAFAACAGVWVLATNHHARNACIDERLRAGRGFAVMGAGFEAHISSGAACGLARHRQRLCFRMRAATIGGAGGSDNRAILYNDAADGWVRPGAPKAALGKARGVEEEGKISEW